jgi:hypothetical protein
MTTEHRMTREEKMRLAQRAPFVTRFRGQSRERYFSEPVGCPRHGLLLAPVKIPLPRARCTA